MQRAGRSLVVCAHNEAACVVTDPRSKHRAGHGVHGRPWDGPGQPSARGGKARLPGSTPMARPSRGRTNPDLGPTRPTVGSDAPAARGSQSAWADGGRAPRRRAPDPVGAGRAAAGRRSVRVGPSPYEPDLPAPGIRSRADSDDWRRALVALAGYGNGGLGERVQVGRTRRRGRSGRAELGRAPCRGAAGRTASASALAACSSAHVRRRVLYITRLYSQLTRGCDIASRCCTAAPPKRPGQVTVAPMCGPAQGPLWQIGLQVQRQRALHFRVRGFGLNPNHRFSSSASPTRCGAGSLVDWPVQRARRLRAVCWGPGLATDATMRARRMVDAMTASDKHSSSRIGPGQHDGCERH